MFAHYILKLISSPAFVFVYLDCPPCCNLIGQEVINKQSDNVLDFNLHFSKSFEKLKKAKKKKKVAANACGEKTQQGWKHPFA